MLEMSQNSDTSSSSNHNISSSSSSSRKAPIQRKRVIYVKVLNRLESIEFAVDTSAEDLRGKPVKQTKNSYLWLALLPFSETLRSAAEANPNDILKLYKSNGSLVPISAECLEENSADQPYQLNFIVKNLISGKAVGAQRQRSFFTLLNLKETNLGSKRNCTINNASVFLIFSSIYF